MKKMVIVKQRDIKDCGVCALSSVIQHYDGYIPIETLRKDTCTSLEGTSAYHLLKAATKYGFDAIGVKCTKKDLLSKDTLLPAILHLLYPNGLSHFVVLYEVHKSFVILMDPAKGKVKMKWEELEKLWSNYTLIFNPKHTIPLLEKPKHVAILFFNIFSQDKTLYFQLIFASFFLTIFSIFSSFFLRSGVNEITNHGSFIGLMILIVLFGMLVLGKVLFQYFRGYFETFLNKNIDIRFTFPFLEHLFSLPLSIVKNRTAGEIVTRVGELFQIKELFSKMFVSIFLDSLIAVVAMVFLYRINHTLFWILCLVCLIYLVWALITSPILYREVRSQIEAESDFQADVIRNIEGIESIKNMQMEHYRFAELEKNTIAYFRHKFSLSSFVLCEESVKNFIHEIGVFLIIAVGLFTIFNGKMTLVDLMTFQSLLMYFFEPLRNLIDLLPQYNMVKASFDKISEFMALEEEDVSKRDEEFLNGDIWISDVSFSYNQYHDVIKDISMQIKQGEHILLSGPSGCGKSTLCKCIVRNVSGYQGNIFIGGVSVLDYRLDTIRQHISYVSQREMLFQGRILENLMLDREISLEELYKVLDICEASDFIHRLPLQMNTMLTDGATNLSGGQRQRLILARALLKPSDILILDEALSEVDAKTEQKIIDQICKHFQDKTIIYITHHKHISGFDREVSLV